MCSITIFVALFFLKIDNNLGRLSFKPEPISLIISLTCQPFAKQKLVKRSACAFKLSLFSLEDTLAYITIY